MDKFDYLRKWFALNSDVLRNQFDDVAKKVTEELLVELADPDSQGIDVSEENFPTLVVELHELMVIGSKEFGKSLLLAEELASTGRLDEAIAELNEFVKWTPSKFYKSMSTKQIERLTSMGSDAID